MRNIFLNRKNGNDENDWVLEHLDDGVRLQPSPYLWTRIRARIRESETEKPQLIPAWQGIVNWMLPIALIITITLGVWVGKEFSFTYQQQFQNIESNPGLIDYSELPPEVIITTEETDFLMQEINKLGE